jgi:prepilin-type N-terminal cleavage/methylation domain-containing protein
MEPQFRSMVPRGSARGFTLIELLVVVVLMGLAVALVAPALIPGRPDESALSSVVRSARDAAARRQEVLYLRIDRAGNWLLEGAASPSAGVLASGRVEGVAGPMTLVLSPVGTCGFDVRSLAAAPTISLDPLTCEIGTP